MNIIYARYSFWDCPVGGTVELNEPGISTLQASQAEHYLTIMQDNKDYGINEHTWGKPEFKKGIFNLQMIVGLPDLQGVRLYYLRVA